VPIHDTIALTWAHRDRIFQTTDTPEDHTDASIGPETGVSYEFRATPVFDDGTLGSPVEIASLGQDLSYYWTEGGQPDLATHVRLEIVASRDAYENWQNARHDVQVFTAPQNIAIEYGAAQGAISYENPQALITSDGFRLVTSDGFVLKVGELI